MAVPYIADSFLRAKNAMNRISDEVSGRITRAEAAMATIQTVSDELNTMGSAFPNGWLETVQYIDTQAAANPDDTAWQDLKAEKDKLVADYQAAHARFQTVANTINGM